ncbi:glyoxalase I-like protein GILP, putative [Hepatocystis sp. ex Piliocolobus tephrosceles]|nr:glyoxalase I-like protein GILP, putative [Hepatocystis sp. ex Piliocolobus tephrosceles]
MGLFLPLLFHLFLFFFQTSQSLIASKKNLVYFMYNHNNVRKKEKYICTKLNCKLEGIEYKVKDLNKSIDFYKNVLGFKELERNTNFVKMVLDVKDAYIKLIQKGEQNMIIPEHAFLGLGINSKKFEISKTKTYEGKVEEEIEKRPITACILPDEDAQERKYWTNCFITDPDGYGIEVVLQEETDENKLDRIRLFTTSTKDAQKFYSDILGFELIKIQSHLNEISYPWNIYGGMSYFFSSKKNKTILQMAYAYDEDKLHMGNSLGNLIISIEDLNIVEKKLNENNLKIVKTDDGINVKDLDGYSVRLEGITK